MNKTDLTHCSSRLWKECVECRLEKNAKDHIFRCGSWPTKFTSLVITSQSQSVKRESTFWNNCSLLIPPPPSPPYVQNEGFVSRRIADLAPGDGGARKQRATQLLFSFVLFCEGNWTKIYLHEKIGRHNHNCCSLS